MPLIIGDLKATITVMPSSSGVPDADGAADVRDSEHEHLRRQAARRFELERQILQRDPDLLGGQ